MNKNNRIHFLIYAAAALTLLLIFLTTVFGGAINVGATEKHWPIVVRTLRTTMENSVRKHAKEIKVPDTLNLLDPKFARQFYGHYSAACRTCHGAPGKKPDPWMVIYPPAPDLTQSETVGKWSDAELYWIIKHGIKNTGMMALGPTHPESAIWGVTALVKQLPDMSSQEYQAMEKWLNEQQGKE